MIAATNAPNRAVIAPISFHVWARISASREDSRPSIDVSRASTAVNLDSIDANLDSIDVNRGSMRGELEVQPVFRHEIIPTTRRTVEQQVCLVHAVLLHEPATQRGADFLCCHGHSPSSK